MLLVLQIPILQIKQEYISIIFYTLPLMSKINKISLKSTSKQNKYKFDNIEVYTPYEIYQSQHSFIAYVLKCLDEKSNALIQSPTGTGKTISLLCSTIAWAYENQQNNKEPPPQIIYASRTHSQLKQVVSEIYKLCYNLRISILSSRDQSCANEDLKLLRGQDKELECRLRIAQRKGLSCNLYQGESFYQKQELGKLMDLEQITLKGKLQGFCPFYYQRFSRPTANIVLIPYNYLFDKKVWSDEEGLRLDGSILILDESHNIQSVCQQYRQYTITLSTLARAMQQADDLRTQKLNQNKNKLDPGLLQKIKMMKVTTEDIEINAAYIQVIYQHLQTLDIPSDPTGILYTVSEFTALLDKATENTQFGTLSKNIKQLINAFINFKADLMFIPFWALEAWMKFIEKINDFMGEGGCQRSGVSQFTIQIAYEGADIRISLHCLDPSGGFKEVIQQHKPRSIILTSGTLSPLKAWPLELGVQFAQPVSCPHVLAPEQVNTIILGVGPSGSSIDTKFDNRKSVKLYQDIGQAICQIVENTPNGVVVLFPSYSFLETTKTHLANQKMLTRLYQSKNIYYERKDASDFTTTLQRYMKQAQTQKGALLFGLVRGRVSEGLDFAHKKCRAIVLVGVPYPCSKDVKVVAKMNYLDAVNHGGQKTLSGSQWYLAETVRAINQSIGRLIRTPDDFGTVYLLDARFAKADIQGQLASWARISLFKPKTYQEFVQKVHEINKTKRKHEMQNIQREMGLTSIGGITLSPNIQMPPRTIRSSISRALPTTKTIQELAAQNINKSTLKQLLSEMKQQKEVRDHFRRSQQLQAQAELQILEREKISHEKRIFAARKTVAPLQRAKQTCPICQLDAYMVKSSVCNHSLCQQCWDKWLQQDLRCPICRGRVRTKFLVP